jgi:hypothetical protein
MPAAPPDPLEQIPDPDTVRRMLADAVRRSDLLRSLLRVARRKAAYEQPCESATSAPRQGVAGG